jgi:hypothetical protein
MKKLLLLLSFILMLFVSKNSFAQIIDTPIQYYIVNTPMVYKPFPVTGRVIGVNLENVQGVAITNICSAEKAITDNNGIYHINGAKGDTLAFEILKYSRDFKGIKSPKENLNVIMIKRKADNLPSDHSKSDYRKARNEDDELYRILEKDAKLEGKWNY